MSDCVGWTKGRAFPRLALAGLGLIFLSGCSSDVARFSQSDNPFYNPFVNNTTHAAADARSDDVATRARLACRLRNAHGFALQAAGGRVDRRRVGPPPAARRLSSPMARPWTRFPDATACPPPRCSPPTASPTLPTSRGGCTWWCPSIMPMNAPSPRRLPTEEVAAETSSIGDDGRGRRAAATSAKTKTAKTDKPEKVAEKTKPQGDKVGKRRRPRPRQRTPTGGCAGRRGRAMPSRRTLKGQAIDATPTGNVESGRFAMRRSSPTGAEQADAARHGTGIPLAGARPDHPGVQVRRQRRHRHLGAGRHVGAGGGERRRRLLGRRAQGLRQPRAHQASERVRLRPTATTASST